MVVLVGLAVGFVVLCPLELVLIQERLAFELWFWLAVVGGTAAVDQLWMRLQ